MEYYGSNGSTPFTAKINMPEGRREGERERERERERETEIDR